MGVTPEAMLAERTKFFRAETYETTEIEHDKSAGGRADLEGAKTNLFSGPAHV